MGCLNALLRTNSLPESSSKPKPNFFFGLFFTSHENLSEEEKDSHLQKSKCGFTGVVHIFFYTVVVISLDLLTPVSVSGLTFWSSSKLLWDNDLVRGSENVELLILTSFSVVDPSEDEGENPNRNRFS